ncbi:DUF6907 domain-containing protein [Streptomyces hokutonensis]|uniref:DUF6907 domain-containing protein n=1 Tax=Streptomyces hokutonensis TaxID=1306990 RepID=A0ABW6M796_9ACTN
MSDEQERAQRSVERMFPEVARFMGQLRHELPLFGPTDLFDDEGITPDVIVRVDYALSRQQLHAALVVAFTEIAEGRSPEDLSVVEIRTEVEGYFAGHGIVAVDNQIADDEHHVFTAEQQRIMQGLAEAIERAYPPRRDRAADAVQSPRYAEGTVTLQTLDRGEVTLPEPSWCTGHEGELVGPLSEVSHDGPEISAFVAAGRLGEVLLMRANLTHAPYLEIEPEPHPLVYVEAQEAASFDADGLRALVATGRAYLNRLEALAGQLDELAEEGSS